MTILHIDIITFKIFKTPEPIHTYLPKPSIRQMHNQLLQLFNPLMEFLNRLLISLNLRFRYIENKINIMTDLYLRRRFQIHVLSPDQIQDRRAEIRLLW